MTEKEMSYAVTPEQKQPMLSTNTRNALLLNEEVVTVGDLRSLIAIQYACEAGYHDFDAADGRLFCSGRHGVFPVEDIALRFCGIGKRGAREIGQLLSWANGHNAPDSIPLRSQPDSQRLAMKIAAEERKIARAEAALVRLREMQQFSMSFPTVERDEMEE